MQIQRPIIDVTNMKTGKGGFLVSQYVRRDGADDYIGQLTYHDWLKDKVGLK